MSEASIILPAHDEADYIGNCLSALLASDGLPAGWQVEVIVVANGCTDATGDIARCFDPGSNGWRLQVIEVAKGGKLNALNVGDAAARGDIRIYLDADVIVSPALIGQLLGVLDTAQAQYSSGQPVVAPARSWITCAYARFWARLPFVRQGVPGFGIFAMNAAGRARWGDWPDIISDDTFARLNFAPHERIGVAASYSWPMVEGFANLVRVRRRQNAGVAEIGERFPELLRNDDQRRVSGAGLLGRMVRDPIGFGIYAAVSLTVKAPLFRSDNRWARGR